MISLIHDKKLSGIAGGNHGGGHTTPNLPVIPNGPFEGQTPPIIPSIPTTGG